jgi:hypothetical protein
VRCVRYADPEADSAWLRIGEEYTVLSITIDPRLRTSFRILGSDGRTPALFSAELFITTATALAPNWVVEMSEPGRLQFAPRSWLIEGFWERFLDMDQAAVATFDLECRVILGAESGPPSKP